MLEALLAHWGLENDGGSVEQSWWGKEGLRRHLYKGIGGGGGSG